MFQKMIEAELQVNECMLCATHVQQQHDSYTACLICLTDRVELKI